VLRDSTRRLPLGDLYEIVLNGAYNKQRAHDRFIHYNIVQIREATLNGEFNLFIPLHLGGLGWKRFPGVRTPNITHFQQKFAFFMRMKTLESLSKGVFPKKYMSALVDDSELKNRISCITVHKTFSPLELRPYGPIPCNYKLLEEDKEMLTSLECLDPKKDINSPHDFKEVKMKYRNPGDMKREFNKYYKECMLSGQGGLNLLSKEAILTDKFYGLYYRVGSDFNSQNGVDLEIEERNCLPNQLNTSVLN